MSKRVSVRRVVKATWKNIGDDRVLDLAAMLTYYTLFALVPAVVFLLTIGLLVIPDAVLHDAFRMAVRAMPHSVRDAASNLYVEMQTRAAGGVAVVGLLMTIWGASRGADALARTLNVMHGVRETRPWWRQQLTSFGVTLLVTVLILLATSLLIVGPLVGHWVADRFNLGAAFDTAWNIGRWVGAAGLVMLVWACLYYFLPNIKRPFRWVTPGAIVGVILWLIASQAFALLVSHVTDYSETYGGLGSILLFLTWIWISNLALLIGGEVDDAFYDERAGVPKEPKDPPDRGLQETPAEAALNQKPLVPRTPNPLQPSQNASLPELARRIGDDLSTLAKHHLELVKVEASRGLKKAAIDTVAITLGAIVALIGIAMLCATAVVVLEPVIGPLWVRMLLMSVIYVAAGGGAVVGFIKKLRGEPSVKLQATREEAAQTARALQESVQHG